MRTIGVYAFDLYEARLVTGRFVDRRRSPLSTDAHGEGDPWIAPDGSYLIFTRWTDVPGWEKSCDLYVAFRDGDGWGRPVALDAINTPGPDFAPAVSPDGERLFYRGNYRFYERPLAPLLEEARRHARG